MPYPKYDFNKYLRSGVDKAHYLKALYAFIKPELKILDQLSKASAIDRIRATLVQEKYECDYNDVSKALANNTEADQELKHKVSAYNKCQKYISQRIETINLNQLKKGHEILLRGTNKEKYGGILRNLDQKQNIAANYEPPKNDQLNDLIGFLLEHIKKASPNYPFIHALSVYLLFDIVQPFIVFNQAYSLIFFNAILKNLDADFNGLISFEKYMLNDWNTHNSIKLNSLFPINAKERIGEDLTAFFENCFTILGESLADVEDNLITSLKESVNYKKMRPIARNSFNYFFEMGFKKFHKKITALNERQQAILRDVIFNRNVTTKQMVMKYRCDRKTIQRDFADLMELGIVAFEGKTKTVNYHLSFA
ncbi:MAG: hypothetical protein ACPGLV_00260 [Bacteroidia bacterium]